MNHRVSDAVIRRLPAYYRHLRELEAEGVVQISSQEMGERMGLTPSQIRQDINCFGGFGRQGYGYNVAHLKKNMGIILGIDKPHRMILVGAGNIGSAVASYRGFAREGFTVEAVFDADPAKIGGDCGGITVRDAKELEGWLQENPADIAVLAVPVAVAQETCDRLTACGVSGIWNFTPTDLHVPDGAVVQNVHLSDTLEILSFRMAHREQE